MLRFRWILAVAAPLVGLAAIAAILWRPWSPGLSDVSLEVRGTGSISRAPNALEGEVISAGKNRAEIRGGRVLANGQDGGPVKSGDAVVLDNDGRLLVNGQERSLK